MNAPRLLLLLLLSAAFTLRAETILFDESFDTTPPYTPGARLPLGFGNISHGKWYADNIEGFPIEAREEQSRSEPMSLLLEATKAPEDPSRIARVWASWGEDNQVATPVTQPMTFACAFLAERVDGDEEGCAALSITGHSGAPVCTVLIGVGGAVAVRNQGTTEVLASIAANQWYVLEIQLPATENPQTPLTITLHESQGTERGKMLGSLQLPDPKPDTIYQGFRIENRLPESKIFFDDFVATTEGAVNK